MKIPPLAFIMAIINKKYKSKSDTIMPRKTEKKAELYPSRRRNRFAQLFNFDSEAKVKDYILDNELKEEQLMTLHAKRIAINIKKEKNHLSSELPYLNPVISQQISTKKQSIQQQKDDIDDLFNNQISPIIITPSSPSNLHIKKQPSADSADCQFDNHQKKSTMKRRSSKKSHNKIEISYRDILNEIDKLDENGVSYICHHPANLSEMDSFILQKCDVEEESEKMQKKNFEKIQKKEARLSKKLEEAFDLSSKKSGLESLPEEPAQINVQQDIKHQQSEKKSIKEQEEEIAQYQNKQSQVGKQNSNEKNNQKQINRRSRKTQEPKTEPPKKRRATQQKSSLKKEFQTIKQEPQTLQQNSSKSKRYPKRYRFKPMQYWKNEKIEYRKGKAVSINNLKIDIGGFLGMRDPENWRINITAKMVDLEKQTLQVQIKLPLNKEFQFLGFGETYNKLEIDQFFKIQGPKKFQRFIDDIVQDVSLVIDDGIRLHKIHNYHLSKSPEKQPIQIEANTRFSITSQLSTQNSEQKSPEKLRAIRSRMSQLFLIVTCKLVKEEQEEKYESVENALIDTSQFV